MQGTFTNWKRHWHDYGRDEGEAAAPGGGDGERQEAGSDQAAEHAEQQGQLGDSRRFQM